MRAPLCICKVEIIRCSWLSNLNFNCCLFTLCVFGMSRACSMKIYNLDLNLLDLKVNWENNKNVHIRVFEI